MNFSVSMCVYDKDDKDYFYEALQSIINQSLLPKQIVLVVDGAISDVLDIIIKDFASQCLDMDIVFDVVYIEQNVGHGKARAVSIQKAKYELIALMDSDDISRYDRFEKQIAVFKNDLKLSVCGAQIMEITHNGKKKLGIREVPQNDSDIKRCLKVRCPFNQMSVMFKKSDVLDAGGYVDFYHNEDYYLWVRMYLNGCRFYNLNDILLDVRVDEEFFARRCGYKYFLSEYNIQKFMYKNSIISWIRFLFNISVRFVLQVVLNDSIRGFVFQKLFRKKI